MCWVHWHYWLLAQKTDHSLYLWEAVWKESKRKRRTTDDFYFLQSFSHIRWKSHIWNGERIQLQDLSSNMFMTNLDFFFFFFFLIIVYPKLFDFKVFFGNSLFNWHWFSSANQRWTLMLAVLGHAIYAIFPFKWLPSFVERWFQWV